MAMPATNLIHAGQITLHHGTGIARVYKVIGSRGNVYMTSAQTCDCPAGLNGRRCYHVDAVVLLQAQDAEPADTPAADPFALLPEADDDAIDFAMPADHAVTITTAAELLGGSKPLKVATVKGYLRVGKLTALDGGVSAASISAYAATRAVNVAKTRFRPTGRRRGARPASISPASVTTVPAAHAALIEARKLEAMVKELRAAAKATLETAGAGTVVDGLAVVCKPGRQIRDSKQIDADYKARGQAVPMTTSAPSWDVVPVSR